MRPVILIFFIFGSFATHANPITRHPDCLDAVYAIQKIMLKHRSEYNLKAAELKPLLPEGCRNQQFEIRSREKQGYRFTMEWHGQVWQITDQKEIKKLAHRTLAEEKTAGQTAPTDAPAGTGTATAAPNGPPPPPAVFAVPLVGSRSITLNLARNGGDTLSTGEKTQSCYAKSKFYSKDCTEHFEVLEARCKAEAASSKVCIDHEKAVKSAGLEGCDDANHGRCMLHLQRLRKNCASPLMKIVGECAALSTFLATYVPEVIHGDTDTMPRAARSPAASCARGDRQVCAAEYCQRATNSGATPDDIQLCAEAQGVQTTRTTTLFIQNTRLLNSSLYDLSGLRPIQFDWKKSKLRDVGFLAEDVARTNPDLAVYDEQGKVQGVKYPQISALLTGAVQELQARTNSLKDNGEDLQKRIKALESANARLESENKELRKILDRINQDLGRVKAKAGFTE